MQNKNNILIVILLVIIAAVLIFIALKKPRTEIVEIPVDNTPVTQQLPANNPPKTTAAPSTTYTYKNHGFTIELPKGYVPNEQQSEGGPMVTITLPNGWITYVTNATWWEQNILSDQEFVYVKNVVYGGTTFKMYKHKHPEAGDDFYYFRQGNVAYVFYNGGSGFFETLGTFKFVGWN